MEIAAPTSSQDFLIHKLRSLVMTPLGYIVTGQTYDTFFFTTMFRATQAAVHLLPGVFALTSLLWATLISARAPRDGMEVLLPPPTVDVEEGAATNCLNATSDTDLWLGV